MLWKHEILNVKDKFFVRTDTKFWNKKVKTIFSNRFSNNHSKNSKHSRYQVVIFILFSKLTQDLTFFFFDSKANKVRGLFLFFFYLGDG